MEYSECPFVAIALFLPPLPPLPLLDAPQLAQRRSIPSHPSITHQPCIAYMHIPYAPHPTVPQPWPPSPPSRHNQDLGEDCIMPLPIIPHSHIPSPRMYSTQYRSVEVASHRLASTLPSNGSTDDPLHQSIPLALLIEYRNLISVAVRGNATRRRQLQRVVGARVRRAGLAEEG
jgi:hypothetical protein